MSQPIERRAPIACRGDRRDEERMEADAERGRAAAAADRSVHRAIAIISRWVVGLSLLLVGVAFFAWGAGAALGAAAGGALASTEWVLSAAIGRRVAAAGDRTRVVWALLFAVKSVATFGSAALSLLFLDARGLALGFGALAVGLIGGAIEAQLRADRPRGPG